MLVNTSIVFIGLVVSVSCNIKRRLNVRRLISLKEEDICFQRFLMLSLPAATYKRASISSGLKGGGGQSKQKNWTIQDWQKQ